MAQQIKKKFIGADQVDGSKIKLLKDQAVRGQKQDGSEVELLKLDSSDKLVSQGQEIAFKSQLDQEVQDRIAGDSQISSNLAQEVQDRIAGDSQISSNLAQEVQDRIAGDSQISSNLAQEVQDRIAGDSQISSNLAQEILDRQAGDSLLSSGLAQEILDRQVGDSSTLSSAQAYTDQKVSDLVNSAPEVLDTLKELADALGGDANFAATVAGQIGAVDDKVDQEILDRIAGDSSTLSSANAYTDSKIAMIPPVDLSNFYNKSQVDAKDLVLSNRISPLESYDQETVHVDNVNGVDEVGRGTLLRPFKTINYAFSQVESLGNHLNTVYNANVGRFLTEKLVIRMAPGTYTENVVLNFKRARVALVGNGVTIVGDVRMEIREVDFPASSLRGATMAASFPAPWTGWTSGALQCFEIAGEAGGGVQADSTSNTVQVTGLTSIVFSDSPAGAINGNAFIACRAGSGVGDTWDSKYGAFYSYVKSASLSRGIVYATQHSAATPSITECNFEIDGSRIGSDLTIRNYFGAVPHSYIANYATWSTANGTTNKAPTGIMNCKVHNTFIDSVLGPRLQISDFDSCRIRDIDHAMGGTVDNGAITGNVSSSTRGIVNTQFRTSTGTNQMRLGATTGTTRLKIDSVSYTTLAFGRNSSGVLSARTLSLGGTSFDFLDDARSIFVNDPATNYSRSASTVDAALEGIDAALGLKADQSVVSGIQTSVSSLQSSVSSLQSTSSSLQSQITTEKGRIDAILSASQADKDSFAEIVALINSVDTANDTAFAGYVSSNNAAVASLQSSVSILQSEMDSAQSELISLDSRLDALEAQPEGPNFNKEVIIYGPGPVSLFQDLAFQAIPWSVRIHIGRLALHETSSSAMSYGDYTTSVVNGVTRIHWNPAFLASEEGISEGDMVHITYAYNS